MFGNSVLWIFCFSIITFCLITMCHFVAFLSFHTYLNHGNGNKLSYSSTNDGSVIDSVVKNAILLMLFMLQHSLQANASVKSFLEHRGYGVVERLLYICGTCACLQILMHYWQPIPSITFWMISTKNNLLWWWFFTVVHSTSWVIMYSFCLIMDISEFLGVKQVYNYHINWPPPELFKSESLKRFYFHFRHVSFFPLAVILFCHPVMQLDRLLISYAFIIYMIVRFKVDDADYRYQHRMMKLKLRVLQANING